MNWFERINGAIEDAEGAIITLVTTLIPWLAPLLPAYLTYSHLTGEIGIPGWVAAAMALSVEFLGLAAIATAFAAMRHNKTQSGKAKMRKVSLAFPVAAYVFYITIVLTVNVVLSLPLTPAARQYAQVAALAGLTLISAPAFVIAVSRQDQRDVEREWRESRPDKEKGERPKAKMHTRARATYAEFAVAQVARAKPMDVQEIIDNYRVSRRTAYNWLERFREERERQEL